MMIKRITSIFLTAVLSVALTISSGVPGAVGLGAAAANAGNAAYIFKPDKSAVTQLEDLFTTMDIIDVSIPELGKEMEKGNATSRQITQMYIDRIKAYDKKKKLNSVISINPEALSEAKKMDAERAAGKVRGPLHGIPVIVKDNIDAVPTATSGGSVALADFYPSKDSFVVNKLKKAGAVIVAKANLSEFACSAVDSHSLLGGYVHNAYDITRTPAGSSGGTAVAVTSNFAAAGLGTDTGGSIRNPSSYSNLYGLRPSKGLTSVSGIIPLLVPRDTVGPMARTAEDAAIILEAIAGKDDDDDFTVEAGADSLASGGYTGSLSEDSLKGKRIGYFKSSFNYDEEIEDEGSQSGDDEDEQPSTHTETVLPDETIEQMVKRTRADLKKAGAQLVDLSEILKDEIITSMLEYFFTDRMDPVEYDFNKYLHRHADTAPFDTIKALLKTGKMGIDYSLPPLNPATEEEWEALADSWEATVDPYNKDVNGFARYEAWEKVLEYRSDVNALLEDNDIDAVIYIRDFEPPHLDDGHVNHKFNKMGNAYAFLFGPLLGMPDLSVPMGFGETTADYPVEMPLGMNFIGKFGDEKTLFEIAYAYEKQAGGFIRRAPESSPALPDENLNDFTEDLVDAAYSINYAKYNKKPAGKVKIMEAACDKALAVDTDDPYAAYKATKKLARSYDSVIAALKASGLKPQAKAKTSFKVSPMRKTIKAKTLKKKKVSFKIKVKKLTAGSSKPVFSISKVTKGQKKKVKVGKKTGKVVIKKGAKKCVIKIRITSKENQKRLGMTKYTVIRVK